MNLTDIIKQLEARKEVLSLEYANAEEGSLTELRIKGRIEELDYWLNFFDVVENGEKTTPQGITNKPVSG
jgi:hypothetical protein